METSELYSLAEKRLIEYQKETRKRCSSERFTILLHICSMGRHFSADKVIKKISSKEHISLPTIYTNLSLFCDAHIIRLLPMKQKKKAEYEFCIGKKNVMRYVCMNCGREVKFENKAIERQIGDRSYSNFIADNFTLTVYGRCMFCRRMQMQESPKRPDETI